MQRANHFKRVFTLLGVGLLIFFYQNFSTVGPDLKKRLSKEQLFPGYNLKAADRDLRQNGDRTQHLLSEMHHYHPHQRVLVVAPEGGHDLKSIGEEWMRDQGSHLIEGADQKIVDQINEQLNSQLKDWTQPKKQSAGRGPASVPNDKDAAQAAADEASEPIPLRFTRVDQVAYAIDKDSEFKWTAGTSGAGSVDYSQKLNTNTSIGFEHQSGNQQTNVQLKMDW